MRSDPITHDDPRDEKALGRLLADVKALPTKTTGNYKQRDRLLGQCTWPEYRVWVGMRERCKNPKDASYHTYGGRGIAVCQRWNASFLLFIEDMGRRPSPQHQLDRIDNDGHYEPGNVRWVLPAENMRNTRYTHNITAFGKTQCLLDWATEMGLNPITLHKRIVYLHWDTEKALKTPASEAHRRIKLVDPAALEDAKDHPAHKTIIDTDHETCASCGGPVTLHYERQLAEPENNLAGGVACVARCRALNCGDDHVLDHLFKPDSELTAERVDAPAKE